MYLFVQTDLGDSGYLTAKRRPLCGKENTLPHKRVRKALAPSWSTPGVIPGVTELSFAETPVSVRNQIKSNILGLCDSDFSHRVKSSLNVFFLVEFCEYEM